MTAGSESPWLWPTAALGVVLAGVVVPVVGNFLDEGLEEGGDGCVEEGSGEVGLVEGAGDAEAEALPF